MAQRSFDEPIKQYVPTGDDQFSAKELSRSYWIVTHKVLFRNIFIMILLAVDICLIGYAVTRVGSYMLGGASREDAIVVAIAQRLQRSSVEKLKAGAPKDITFGGAQAFDGGNSSVDFAAEVENVNPTWYATVKYNFQLGSPEKTTDTVTTFVMPGERKFLLALGVKNVELLSGVTLNVMDVAWQRIDSHQIPDAQEFIKQHGTFETVNAVFTPQGVVVKTAIETNPGNQIAFDIINRTNYNFYEVPLQILLLRGGTVQAIEYATVKNFRTGETRHMDVRNFVQGLTIDDVQVIPTVNVFDPDVYVSQ